MATLACVTRLRLDNSVTHAADTQLTWHAVASVFDTPAGQSVGVYIIRDLGGGVTPATPDSLTLRYVDDGGNIIRTVTLNTTANSQTDTFYLTSDGTSGGTARCDTIEMKLQATRAGVGSYDVESDGSPNTPPAGFDSHLDRGYIRGNTTQAEAASNASAGGAKNEPAEYDESLFLRATSGAASYIARALAVASSAGSLSGNTNSATSATRDVTFSAVVDDRFPSAVTDVGWTVTVPNSTLGAVPAWGFTQTTPDTSGNNRTGYLSGTVRPVVVATPLAGMDFDGVDREGNTQIVHCGVTGFGVSTADGSCKVKAKIRRGRTGIAEILAGKWWGEGPAAGQNYVLYVDAADKLNFAVVDGTGAGWVATGTTSLAANTDYDTEGEWTGAVLQVKVNGVQEGTTPAVTTMRAPDTVTPFTIGAETYSPFGAVTSDPFDGIITNVEMYRGGVLQGQWALTTVTSGITDDSIDVDPRGTGQWHMQKGAGAFAIASHDATFQMLNSEIGKVAMRVVTARTASGINNLQGTIVSTPEQNPSQAVTLNFTTALRDGQNGWTQQLEICPTSKPGGNWNCVADITTPTDIDSNPHLVGGTQTILVQADDPSLALRVEAGDPTTPNDHWVIGRPMVVGMVMMRRTKANGVIELTRLAIDSGTGKFAVASFNYALGRIETLAGDLITWEYVLKPHLFSTAVSPGDAWANLYTFDAATTAQWGANRGGYFVQGGAENGGIYKAGGGKTDSLGIAGLVTNPHSRWHPIRESLG